MSPLSFYGDKLPKPLADLASLPEPEAKPNPIEVFAAASEDTLQNIMLARMTTAANIRRDIDMLMAELAEQVADAKLAEMLLAQKQRCIRWVDATLGGKSQVQEFQRLRIIREHRSKEKASCLGKSELQPQRIGPLETYCQIR